jgi:hypothetical protein
MSTELNVSQPSPQIGVGFGPVVKFREIYVHFVDALSSIYSGQATPIALGDLLSYRSANVVQSAVAADGLVPAGFASYEAVVNSTGVWGYKPQAGDPIGVFKKGRFYCVNVEGVVNMGDELVAGITAGSIRSRTAPTDPTIGRAMVGNASVAGAPIEAEIDTTVVQNLA